MTLILENFVAGDPGNSLHEHHASDAYRRLSGYLSAAHTALLRIAHSDDEQERFRTWFGEYTVAGRQEVWTKVQAIHRAVVTREITFRKGGSANSPNTYAYVRPDTGLCKVYLCDLFFASDRAGRDSAVGTIIHELSHLEARTDDYCYGPIPCRALALEAPARARSNADSFQYYCESFA